MWVVWQFLKSWAPQTHGWIHQRKLQEGDIVPKISVSSFYIPPILKTSVKTGVPYLFLATFRQAALCQLQTTGVNFTVFWLLSWAFRAWRIRFHDPSSGRRGKRKKCHSTLVCPNPGDWKINRNLHIPSAKNIRKSCEENLWFWSSTSLASHSKYVHFRFDGLMAPASFHRKWPQGDEELRSNVYQIYKPFFSFFSEGGLKLWSHGEKGGPAFSRGRVQRS